MIPYTAGDYKKYVYAEGKHRVSRIREIIAALERSDSLNFEDAEDLDSLLVNVVYVLWRAAFVDDHRQADDCAQWWCIAWPPTHPVPDSKPEEARALKAADTYSDGRPVSTTFRFGPADDDYIIHVWHPDPEHPDNQPAAEHEFSRGPHPFRFGLLEVAVPGTIRVLYDDERKSPEDPDLTEGQSRVLEALRERQRNGMVPSHIDAKHLAQQLGMSEQEVVDHEVVLSAHGLIHSPLVYLTEDQQRVLRALPDKDDCDPSDPSTYITDAQLARQLGMSEDKVKQHLRVLDRLGWMWHPPRTQADKGE